MQRISVPVIVGEEYGPCVCHCFGKYLGWNRRTEGEICQSGGLKGHTRGCCGGGGGRGLFSQDYNVPLSPLPPPSPWGDYKAASFLLAPPICSPKQRYEYVSLAKYAICFKRSLFYKRKFFLGSPFGSLKPKSVLEKPKLRRSEKREHNIAKNLRSEHIYQRNHILSHKYPAVIFRSHVSPDRSQSTLEL